MLQIIQKSQGHKRSVYIECYKKETSKD